MGKNEIFKKIMENIVADMKQKVHILRLDEQNVNNVISYKILQKVTGQMNLFTV